VLNQWRTDSTSGTVTGTGQHLDHNRVVQTDGPQQVAMDSVALLETNVLHKSAGIASMAVLTGVSAAVTVVCLADTKACFGSCPTFYVSDGERPMLMAEGFSGSIAPALEARDIDALYHARPHSRTLDVELKNEALETHVIRYARILAVPREAGQASVFATQDGRFLQASRLTAPSRCQAAEGDCRADVTAFDQRERTSTADSTDLATRETIDLEFPNSPEHPGLVIASRQSLLTTYLLYQTFAYLGTHATEALSMLERADRPHGPMMLSILGGIEVMVDSAGQWITVGKDFEVGPLATDVRVVSLPRSGGATTRVRLRLTRGNWRLDYLALADLGREVTPIRLDPFEVRRGNTPDTVARRLLIDTTRTLVTLPGDAFTLRYRLPEHPERYELFLESRGYYLEWMREEWLKEENPERSRIAILDPARALRILAPEYKKIEPRMDDAFWRSRYARP
jgi:hypothetical protein